jgi:hypothetical protein
LATLDRGLGKSFEEILDLVRAVTGKAKQGRPGLEQAAARHAYSLQSVSRAGGAHDNAVTFFPCREGLSPFRNSGRPAQGSRRHGCVRSPNALPPSHAAVVFATVHAEIH